MKLTTADISVARDLITYARANGWDHIVYGVYGDREHVWMSRKPHRHYSEKVSLWKDGFDYREVDGRAVKATMHPETAAEVRDWLRYLGLVPSVEQVAEAMLTDTTVVGGVR